MQKLGAWLREAREAKGSTLEEAEDSIRIRAHFLEMLEAGDFAALPGGGVQVRGFLRIYARYLGLPQDEVLARYEGEVHGAELSTLQPTPAVGQPDSDHLDEDLTAIHFHPRDIPVSSPLPRWMSIETVIAVGIVLIVLLTVVAVISYVMSQQADERPPAATAPALPSGTTPALTATPTPAPVTPTFSVSPDGDVTLMLEATEHVWVRVTRDGQVALEGLMAPGQSETWSGQERITVETGNGAGLQVMVNGQAQGTVCGRGEVCSRTWEPSGEVNSLSLAATD